MGSYDGAEVCELVGLYMLHKLDQRFDNNKHTGGLYRDDGLAALKDVFNQAGLRITIETNQKVVNYLDITLNLLTEKCYSYRKPGNTPMYINARSNHPPSILKQLPKAISKRISDLSCRAKKNSTAQPLYVTMLSSPAIFPNSPPTTNQTTGQGETGLGIFYGLINLSAKP